jgi:hypothetical protein
MIKVIVNVDTSRVELFPEKGGNKEWHIKYPVAFSHMIQELFNEIRPKNTILIKHHNGTDAVLGEW